MQEMIELSSNQNAQVEHQPRVVQFLSPPYDGRVVLTAGPAQFGVELRGTAGVSILWNNQTSFNKICLQFVITSIC